MLRRIGQLATLSAGVARYVAPDLYDRVATHGYVPDFVRAYVPAPAYGDTAPPAPPDYAMTERGDLPGYGARGRTLEATLARLLEASVLQNRARWSVTVAPATVSTAWAHSDLASWDRRGFCCVACDNPDGCYSATRLRELIAQVAGVPATTPMVILCEGACGRPDEAAVHMAEITDLATVMDLRRPWNSETMASTIPVVTLSGLSWRLMETICKLPSPAIRYDRRLPPPLRPAFP